MRIWKYPLKIKPTQLVSMPDGAKPISVHVQNDIITVWAEVNVFYPKSQLFEFNLVATDGEFDPNTIGKFLGTVLLDEFVWHIYWKPLA